MKKLRDIACYTKIHERNYDNAKPLSGKIIWNDDNTFEGIIVDSEKEENCLVFGKMEEAHLELIKCSMEDRSIPKLYKGSKIGETFNGKYYERKKDTRALIGDCQISVADPFSWRDANPSSEITAIESYMDYFKKHNLGLKSKRLYKEYRSTK